MTPAQKKLLEPFGETLAEWDQKIMDSSPEELAALAEACRAVSTTNCWACMYDAARVLLPYIQMRQEMMRRASEQSVNV